jgi:hypothetical protein
MALSLVTISCVHEVAAKECISDNKDVNNEKNNNKSNDDSTISCADQQQQEQQQRQAKSIDHSSTATKNKVPLVFSLPFP